MSDNVYCYPGTDVLKNKLAIKNAAILFDVERKLTGIRLLELQDSPILGNFDLIHMQKIHRFIFQDIYDWAGVLRTVDITKGNMFCKVAFMKEQADGLFNKLKKESYLKEIEEDVFVTSLAYYFGEINAIHPFREGNGRTQREFARCLCMNAGRKLDFNKITSQDMINASIKSFICDYSALEHMFRTCLNLEHQNASI
jgi:cell filamentation protein